MIFIKNKMQAALIDPLKFVTVSFAAIMPNNWVVVGVDLKPPTDTAP